MILFNGFVVLCPVLLCHFIEKLLMIKTYSHVILDFRDFIWLIFDFKLKSSDSFLKLSLFLNQGFNLCCCSFSICLSTIDVVVKWFFIFIKCFMFLCKLFLFIDDEFFQSTCFFDLIIDSNLLVQYFSWVVHKIFCSLFLFPCWFQIVNLKLLLFILVQMR